MRTLIINEIFYSIQGETSRSGLPTTFVRLTGCPLRCSYCDTKYAFNEGFKKSFDEIITEIHNNKTRYVTITGGEPLAQKNILMFMKELCDLEYSVSIETSNAYSIANIDSRVSIILLSLIRLISLYDPYSLMPPADDIACKIFEFPVKV